MNKLDPNLIQQALDQQMAEITILRVLLMAAIDCHPSKPQVITTFQTAIESLCANSPPGTDPETIVEIRARTQFYLQLLAY